MSVINPATKLQWYQKHMPKKLNAAKAIFLHEVSDVLSNFRYVCVSDNVQLRQYYKGLRHYTINQVMSSVMIHGKMMFWDLILPQIIYNRKLLKLRSSLIFWIRVRVPIPSCSGRYGNSLFMISSTPYSHFPIGEPASVSHYIRTCYGYLAHSRVGSTL